MPKITYKNTNFLSTNKIHLTSKELGCSELEELVETGVVVGLAGTDLGGLTGTDLGDLAGTDLAGLTWSDVVGGLAGSDVGGQAGPEVVGGLAGTALDSH